MLNEEIRAGELTRRREESDYGEAHQRDADLVRP